MFGRILAIEHDQRYLHVSHGFVVINDTSQNSQEIGRVPLDDLAAVIGNANGLSYSNNLLVALSQRAIPFVLCAANHNAVGMLLPVEGNFEQSRRIEAQTITTLPARKRLWAEIVSSKLGNQAQVLAAIGSPSTRLVRLAKNVRSGDPDNLEAQGARHYWQILFGKGFLRDRNAPGINALLNYGYTILRAATARAIVAAGLHPSIGIHHSNAANGMRLADDLIEPFRPFVDYEVWKLISTGAAEISQSAKQQLVGVLYQDFPTNKGNTPLGLSIQRAALSLVSVLLGEQKQLDLPQFPDTTLRQ